MINKRWMVLLVVICLFVPVFVFTVSSDPPISWEWTIDGDTVFIDNSWVYLSATPHTINSSGWVVFEFESKILSENLDAMWGFSSTEARPRYPQIWRNYTHNLTGWRYVEQYLNITIDNCISYERLDISDYDDYIVHYGNENNTKLWNVTYVDDEWGVVNITIAFTTKTIIDEDSIKFFYNDYVVVEYYYYSKFWDWKHFDKDITVEEYVWRGFDKWYSVNATVQIGKRYRVRAWIDIPFDGLDGTSGKYAWVIKEHNKTMQEAVDSGRLLYLDPWWDSIIHTYVCNDVDAQGHEGHADDGVFDNDVAEFTGTEYTAISIDDNNRATYSQNNAGKHSYHHFIFTIAEATNTITQIDVTWKGYGQRADSGTADDSLWVLDTGSWSEEDTAVGVDRSKHTLTAQKTSDFSDWISGGDLEVTAQADDPAGGGIFQDSIIYSYYVEVKITYSITPSIHIGGGTGDGTTSIHILGGHIGGN